MTTRSNVRRSRSNYSPKPLTNTSPDIRFVCPQCKTELLWDSQDQQSCPSCQCTYFRRDGIYDFLLADESRGDAKDRATLEWGRSFEVQHAEEKEPWQYSQRAAEILRHEFVADTVRRLNPFPERILDLGCSIGQMSLRLKGHAQQYFATDMSASALHKSKMRWDQLVATDPTDACSRPVFLRGSAAGIPLPPQSIDLLLCLDGLHSWGLAPSAHKAILEQCWTILRPGSYGIFTDYMRPDAFDTFVQTFHQSPLTVVSVEYLYDRLWYQFESIFHMISGQGWVKWILRNLTIARMLRTLARIKGKNASRHLCVITQKL